MLRAQQPVDGDNVSDHEQGHIEDGNEIRGAKLTGDGRKVKADGVGVVDDEVGDAGKVEGDGEEPEEGTDRGK